MSSLRIGLGDRLRARRQEIEREILARVRPIGSGPPDVDPIYIDGLRRAIREGTRYGLAAVESDWERPPQPPTSLLEQARAAARNGDGLDAVLRRYAAGYNVFLGFLIEEAQEEAASPQSKPTSLFRAQEPALDHLLSAVSEEFLEERRRFAGSSSYRHAERIKRLLNGDLLDISVANYRFDQAHLAIMAAGGSGDVLRALAAALDRELLFADFGEERTAAWLGGSRSHGIDGILTRITHAFQGAGPISVGEPAEGLSGWRLSHRQAVAGFPVAVRTKGIVRYAEVALDAAALQDDLLAASLQQAFISPLEEDRDEGSVALETLRAYFRAERNAASAAALLKISRQAVYSRLRHIEQRLGRTVTSCAAELEVAVRARDLAKRAGNVE